MFANLSVPIMGDDGSFRNFVTAEGPNNGHVAVVVGKHYTVTLAIGLMESRLINKLFEAAFVRADHCFPFYSLLDGLFHRLSVFPLCKTLGFNTRFTDAFWVHISS